MSTAQYNPVSQTLSIPKLNDDGSNWVDYEVKARTAMGSKGLSRHLAGTAIQPKPFDVENGVIMFEKGKPATDEQIEAKEKRLDEYEQKEYLARHIILTSISPRLFATVKGMDSAAKMWDAVKADATASTELHQIDTLQRLQQKKCGESDDMKAHLEELIELRDRLIGMGATVQDSHFRTIILASLPPSYRPVISSIIVSANVSKATITNDQLIRMITEEAETRSILDGGDAANSALIAKEKPKKGKGQDKGDKKRKKCFNCGKLGHIAADCWGPGGGKEGQGPKQQKAGKGKASANVATTAESSETSPHQEYAFITTIPRPSRDRSSVNVVPDSGASSHFCPEREKFTNFVECTTTVTTADKRTFEAIRRGDAEITIPNGNSKSTIKLRDALYAPEMQSILISVPKLDRNGFAAIFKSRGCTIIAPNGQTIGKIPLSDGLYQTNSETAQIATVGPRAQSQSRKRTGCSDTSRTKRSEMEF